MSIPKKKRRSITVNDVTFHWVVGRHRLDYYERPSASVAPFALLHLNVIIESPVAKSKIVADFNGLFALTVPSLGFCDTQDIIITSRIVKKIIEYAYEKLHWNYEKDSSEIRLDHAQRIFPEAIWEGFKEIDFGYDSNKIDEYLKDAIQIWP